jgi:hypothetical protein
MGANGHIILSNGQAITFTPTPAALSLVRLNVTEYVKKNKNKQRNKLCTL